MPQRRVVFRLGISKMKQVVLPDRAKHLLQKHVATSLVYSHFH